MYPPQAIKNYSCEVLLPFFFLRFHRLCNINFGYVGTRKLTQETNLGGKLNWSAYNLVTSSG